MATTTVSGSTVTFSNSGAAANLTQTGTEDGSLTFIFDVLAAERRRDEDDDLFGR